MSGRRLALEAFALAAPFALLPLPMLRAGVAEGVLWPLGTLALGAVLLAWVGVILARHRRAPPPSPRFFWIATAGTVAVAVAEILATFGLGLAARAAYLAALAWLLVVGAVGGIVGGGGAP